MATRIVFTGAEVDVAVVEGPAEVAEILVRGQWQPVVVTHVEHGNCWINPANIAYWTAAPQT